MTNFRAALRRCATAMQAGAASVTPDVLMLSGATSIGYGAWLIYPPAGFIVGGMLAVAGGVLAAKGKR